MVERQSHAPTVLVAEDSDDMRVVVRRFLESRGYHVVEAANGQEAVEAAKRSRPDLILMDLNMPALDGLAAAEEIRAGGETCQPPVIALTAYDVYGMREAALQAGCCEYLTKPIDFDRMAKTISLMIGP